VGFVDGQITSNSAGGQTSVRLCFARRSTTDLRRHDEFIHWWQIASGDLLRKHRGGAGDVVSLSLTRDFRRLASGNTDETLKIWDIETAQELQTFMPEAGHVCGVAFSPDMTQLTAGTSEGALIVWDARPLTPELRAELLSAQKASSSPSNKKEKVPE
jgi:WD40 repeat protein